MCDKSAEYFFPLPLRSSLAGSKQQKLKERSLEDEEEKEENISSRTNEPGI